MIFMILGAILLFFGAEILVRGASSFANRIGLAPVTIGLTVVALATSMPELVVSVGAALEGKGDIAMGNVVGSNIVNIGLIASLSVLILPAVVHLRIVKKDLFWMIVSSLLLTSFIFLSEVGRVAGGTLVILGILYFIEVLSTKKLKNGEVQPKLKNGWIDWFYILSGMGLLLAGGKLFVEGAVDLARAMAISEAVIALSLVAVGTSLPELATSIVASFRGHSDMAIGNVIGSNILNIFIILGLAALFAPIKTEGVLVQDYIAMLAITLLFSFMMFTSKKVNRLEGALLLLIYVAYIIYLYTNF